MKSNYTHEIIEPVSRLPIFFMVYQNSNTFVPSHWHSDLELLWIRKGAMHMVLKDRSYDLLENDLFIVNSNELHSTATQGNTTVWMLQIPSGFLNGYLPAGDGLNFNEYFKASGLHQDEPFQTLCKLMAAMENSFLLREKGYELEFTSIMLSYLCLLYRNFSSTSSFAQRERENRSFDRIKLVLDEVRQNYMHPFSLDQAAQTASLSPGYFCRLFRQYTGNTYLEYLNLIRLAHIHEELLSTNLSVTQLLQKHGFVNYKVFSRMFRQTYGCTPRELRKTNH